MGGGGTQRNARGLGQPFSSGGGGVGGSHGTPGLLGLLGGIGRGQGAMGVPTSALQRQGSDWLGSYLNQPAPEQRALDISMPALQAQLTGTPGGDVLDPLSAIFGRNLTDQIQQLGASAPGRFGSAILEQQGRLRERSTGDFNLLASQIMEQGRARQLQAAQTLAILSGQAGQAPFNRAATATGLGQAETAMGLQNQQFNQQQQLAAIMALLGPAMGPTFGGPFVQNPSGFENFLGLLSTLAAFVPTGGGAPRPPGSQSTPLSTG